MTIFKTTFSVTHVDNIDHVNVCTPKFDYLHNINICNRLIIKNQSGFAENALVDLLTELYLIVKAVFLKF